MNEFEDGLWERLVDEHAADSISLTAAHSRRGPGQLIIGGGATAAITAAAVIALSGSAAPAYAMTQNADGSYTFTINDLATAAPELNAKFKQLGIDETVVTATASCPTTNNITGELQIDPEASSSDSMTFKPGGANLDPGYTGVIGAEQLPDGEIAMTMEAVPPAEVPSCFLQAFRLVQTGDANGVPTVTEQQLSTTTPTG